DSRVPDEDRGVATLRERFFRSIPRQTACPTPRPSGEDPLHHAEPVDTLATMDEGCLSTRDRFPWREGSLVDRPDSHVAASAREGMPPQSPPATGAPTRDEAQYLDAYARGR